MTRDDEILDHLRRLTAEVDPVPVEVDSFAKAAFGWRRIDADLAELLEDSAAQPTAALTRSPSTNERTVMFGVEDFVIELSIEKSDHEHVLVGQLTPPGRALVEVQRDDTSIAASTETDELGSFRVEFLQGGRHRLKIKSEALVRAIETSWIDI